MGGMKIVEDGSSNMSFTDSVTGTRTLAQLASGGGGATFQITATAGENIAAFDSVYINNTGNIMKASNASVGTVPCIGICEAIVLSGNVGTVTLLGVVTNVGWALTPGVIWLGVGGALTQTIPIGSGDVQQVIATAISATQILFNPDANYALLPQKN